MQNLKLDASGDYVYATGTEGPIIELAVEYDLGGWGFLSGKERARGIYVKITPVVIELKNGYSTRCYKLGGNQSQSGGYLLIQELPRKNAKKLLAAAEFLDAAAPVIAETWKTNRSSALSLLIKLVNQYAIKVAA